jgi:hypothetical protein
MAVLGRAAAGNWGCYQEGVKQDARDHECMAAMLQRRAIKPPHPLRHGRVHEQLLKDLYGNGFQRLITALL